MNDKQRYVVIGAAVALAITSVLVATNGNAQDIEQRLQALERRVEQLERRDANAANRKALIDRAAWRSVRLGMSMAQVRGLLGKPHRVSTNQYFTMWYWNYTIGGGSVQFRGSDDVVDGVHERAIVKSGV